VYTLPKWGLMKTYQTKHIRLNGIEQSHKKWIDKILFGCSILPRKVGSLYPFPFCCSITFRPFNLLRGIPIYVGVPLFYGGRLPNFHFQSYSFQKSYPFQFLSGRDQQRTTEKAAQGGRPQGHLPGGLSGPEGFTSVIKGDSIRFLNLKEFKKGFRMRPPYNRSETVKSGSFEGSVFSAEKQSIYGTFSLGISTISKEYWCKSLFFNDLRNRVKCIKNTLPKWGEKCVKNRLVYR